jgi:hypothetical protein
MSPEGLADMEVSELRKRILRAIDDAKKDLSTRRTVLDSAAHAYEEFLRAVAVPLLRQASIVLKASGELFDVHTPAGSVRLVAERSPHTFLEIELDVDRPEPEVIGRVSVTRGRQGLVVEERPIVPGRPVADLTEEDLTAFLVTEIPKLVVRS